LAGREALDLPAAMREAVRDLSFLSSADKHDAYAAADVFIHPGLHESFSITLMEAWLQGAPALVHGDCAVTREAVERSGGGAAFRNFGEFAAALDLLLGNAALRQGLGERGRAYVLETCRWEDVARRTIDAVLS
jgi:glycosyltransferase involved in cell wall biosynthesis